MRMTNKITHADPSWIDGNIPRSDRFSDTYYTKADGRGETDHVFIKGNNLPQRWNKTTQFTIAELGFGTGLNFLETARQWHKSWQKNSALRFVSFELFPLKSGEIRRAISRWDNLHALSERLCENWSSDQARLQMEFPGNIQLEIFFCDANICLSERKLAADAWYLDGFSPSKNPELWNETLMRNVYESTNADGTFSTYSVAGSVRRNLQDAGFTIEKSKGFGSKREMLSGYKAG